MYHFITIEGCIGAGKTTLSKKLAERLNGKLILEHFEDNPFLPSFYEDPDRHAFPVELYFMAERFQHLKNLLTEADLFKDCTISDFLFQKSQIFAGNNLSADEAKLYRMLFDIINPNLPKPDLVIYLYAPVEKLLSNIKRRGRDFEQNIEAEYLQKIQTAYLDFFKLELLPRVVLLDTTHLNFLENERDFEKVIDILHSQIELGITYL